MKLPREIQRPACCRREARRTRAQKRCGESHNIGRTEVSFRGEGRGDSTRSRVAASLEPRLSRFPGGCRSGRPTRVEMVQAAHLGKLDHWSLFRIHHRPRNRAVLRQRPMGTRMVVVGIVLNNGPEVSFGEDDHAIQAFAPDGPDQSFDVWILPRSARRDGLLLDPKGRYTFGELCTVDAIAVAQQVFGRCLEREGADDLLPGPSRRRSLGDGKMQHLPPVVRQHHEHKQDAERDRRHSEEIHGDELLGVMVKKGSPRLRRRPALAFRGKRAFLTGRQSAPVPVLWPDAIRRQRQSKRSGRPSRARGSNSAMAFIG